MTRRSLVSGIQRLVFVPALMLHPACSDGASSASNGTSNSGDSMTGGASGTGSTTTMGNGNSSSAEAGGAGNSGTGIGSEATAGGVADLQINPNPNSVLSAIVTWTTEEATESTVQFGVDGYQWEISDATPTTMHRVVVIGMHAEQTYSVKAISGSVSGEGEFTTGKLPSTIPVGTVMINDTARSQPGWTLMNVQKGDGTGGARSNDPPMAVMYDAEGQPVWYFIAGPDPDIGGAVSTQLTDVGVLIGPTWNQNLTTGVMPQEVDFEGNTVWECSQALCGDKSFSHHASKLSNGHYMLLEDVAATTSGGGPGGGGFGGGTKAPVYHEVTADNQVVWSLDWVSLLPAPAGATGDWCHGNSISVDLEKNTVWANCRWVGLMKVTYDSLQLQWLLPAAYGSMGLGDFTYMPANSQFSDAHDPEVHEDDNTVLFYDNGGFGQGATGGTTTQFRSRAVEYQLDESSMTATLAWEYPGSFEVPDPWYTDNWYSPFWGDADRLENGNVLIAAGIRSPSVESRVFEVTKDDGQVVWEFRFPPDYGVYRADRIVPPLVHPIGN